MDQFQKVSFPKPKIASDLIHVQGMQEQKREKFPADFTGNALSCIIFKYCTKLFNCNLFFVIQPDLYTGNDQFNKAALNGVL